MKKLSEQLPTDSKLLINEARAAISENMIDKIGDTIIVGGRPMVIIKLAKDQHPQDLPSNVDASCLFVYCDYGDEMIDPTWVKPVGDQLLPIPKIIAPHAYPDLINQ
jgi:hypothetical protein